MNNFYSNTKECNPRKEQKMMLVYENMIADVISNKNFHLVII